jgi:HD-like signal output (HDOD) protein
MVEMQAMRTKLVEVFEYRSANGCSFLEAERQIIGATHQEFGSALCEKWKFPSTFSSVTGFHHNPNELGKELRTLTNIVHVADWMSAKLELGFNDDDQRGELDPSILESIKLTPEALANILEELPEATELAEHQLSGD